MSPPPPPLGLGTRSGSSQAHFADADVRPERAYSAAAAPGAGAGVGAGAGGTRTTIKVRYRNPALSACRCHHPHTLPSWCVPYILTARALFTHTHPVVTSVFCAQAVAREAVAASKGGAARGPPGLGPGDVDEVILASRAVDANLAAAAAGGAQVCASLCVCDVCECVGARAFGQPKSDARPPACL